MKIRLIVLIIVFLPSYIISLSQSVGINMKDPQAVLHIDPLGNTDDALVLNRYADDVIVNSGGMIGIGTISPVAKIDIEGKFQLIDGNEAWGKVLVSDVTGLASWKVSQFNTLSVWTLSNATGGMTFSSSIPVQVKGVSAMTESNVVGIANVSNGNGNFVYVPAGKYITILKGQLLTRQGISGTEIVNAYGRIGLRSWEQQSTADDIYVLFTNKAAGSTFVYEASVGQTLYITYAVRSFNQHIGIYQDPPHNNATFQFTLTFIKL